jgi:cation:H+ antiporter
VGRKDVERGLIRLVAGSAALIVASDLIVKLAIQMAELIHIPVLLIGLFLVSIGTTLPELTFEIKTIGQEEYLMVFGNIVGSIVANSALILGLVALLSPINLGRGVGPYMVAVIAFVVMYAIFWFFVYSSKRLERWEGLALVLFYLVFVLVQMRMF